jgi:hypothetical protein
LYVPLQVGPMRCKWHVWWQGRPWGWSGGWLGSVGAGLVALGGNWPAGWLIGSPRLYIYTYTHTAVLFYTPGVECHSTPNQPNTPANSTTIPTRPDPTPPPPDPLAHPAPVLFPVPTSFFSAGERELCHTRFPKGNQMHLICVPGSSSTHMIDEMSVIS